MFGWYLIFFSHQGYILFSIFFCTFFTFFLQKQPAAVFQVADIKVDILFFQDIVQTPCSCLFTVFFFWGGGSVHDEPSAFRFFSPLSFGFPLSPIFSLFGVLHYQIIQSSRWHICNFIHFIAICQMLAFGTAWWLSAATPSTEPPISTLCAASRSASATWRATSPLRRSSPTRRACWSRATRSKLQIFLGRNNVSK